MPAPPLSLRIYRVAQCPLFVLILFCRAPTSPHTSHVSTFCRLYSSWQCRGAHFFAFSFHVEHTSCRSPKPQRLSAFLAFYAYLCIAFFVLCATFCILCIVALPQLFSAVAACLSSLKRICFAAVPMRFLASPASPFNALRSTRQSICFLLCALSADAFCLRRILPSRPRSPLFV